MVCGHRIRYGTGFTDCCDLGNTPLHLAVRTGTLAIVQALVVFGAKLNVENTSGETPRHIGEQFVDSGLNSSSNGCTTI